MIYGDVAVLLLVITNTLAKTTEDYGRSHGTSEDIGGVHVTPDDIAGVHVTSEDSGGAHVNFNEIFTNSLSLINDEANKDGTKDDEFHLGAMPTMEIDFHHQSKPGKNLLLPPKFHAPASKLPQPYFKIIKTTEMTSEEAPSRPGYKDYVDTRTTRMREIVLSTFKPVNVLPLPERQQIGVLDILFPAARVKNFQKMFNTFKRALSYTF